MRTMSIRRKLFLAASTAASGACIIVTWSDAATAPRHIGSPPTVVTPSRTIGLAACSRAQTNSASDRVSSQLWDPIRASQVGASQPPRRVLAPSQTESQEDRWARIRKIQEVCPALSDSDSMKLGYFCVGDFNKDDRVDETDLLLFFEAWSDEHHVLAAWADLDGNGVLDDADVEMFILGLLDGDRGSRELREYRSSIC
ncbi:MAG: hypothetical protein JNM07_00690 [Phycisphaerae bacterium]|nr:hypothetical protein [Phycisphaerae bacterium]